MSDEKTPAVGEDKIDVKKYNEIIEAHNSLKTKYEKAETDLKELTEKKVEETKVSEDKITEQKEIWEKEKVELQKQKEDAEKQVEEFKNKDNTINPKGVVNPPTNEIADFRTKMDAVIPPPDAKVNNLVSKYGRIIHYKNPTTKQYSSQDLGKGLSLHATAQKANPDMVPPDARINTADIKLR